MTKTANINATVNGIRFEGLTLEQAQALAAMATETAKPAKAKAEPKAKAKAQAIRAKHDAILDSKRVERMTSTAINSAAKQGFECKASKQGRWVWLYPCGDSKSKGRTPEFKAIKFAKGWKHSPKRGAFYREF